MSRGPGILKYARLTRRQLIAFTFISAALNGVVTASVGAWLAQTYSSYQKQRQSIDTISNLLYERRTRAGMVASSIRRNADLEEVRERKRAYDDAYVAWNTQALRHLFVIRDVMGDGKGGQADVEQDFQDILVSGLADIDRCLTKAYDARITGGDGKVIMRDCNMRHTYQFVLDCGASFLNEMDKLSRLSFMPWAGGEEEKKAKAEARIRKGCGQPVAAKTGEQPAEAVLKADEAPLPASSEPAVRPAPAGASDAGSAPGPPQDAQGATQN